MTRRIGTAVLITAALLALVSCNRGGGSTAKAPGTTVPAGPLVVWTTPELQPLVEKLTAAFQKENPQTPVDTIVTGASADLIAKINNNEKPDVYIDLQTKNVGPLKKANKLTGGPFSLG